LPYGNAGNRWNEYADALAEAGRLSVIEQIQENSCAAQLDRMFNIAIAK
jgi:hypothetical protein